MTGRLWNSFKIAFSMYSRIPVPGAEWTGENISYAMCFFPWIGGVIGGATWAVWMLREWLLSRQVPAAEWSFTVLLVLLPLILTGGIHMDGFLDTKDALSSYQPREKRLEILKDPHTGAFAIISCAVYMFAYTGIYASLTTDSIKIIALSFVLSRTLSGLSVLCFPQAKKEGLLVSFSKSAKKRPGRNVLGSYLLILCVLMIWMGGMRGAICLVAAGASFLYYYRMSMKNFGGVTGDLAGYFLQMCEILMAAAVVITDIWMKGAGL